MLPSIWIATNIAPLVVGLLFFFATSGLLYSIRFATERSWYEIAWSAFPGDLFLATYCGLIAVICQNELPEGFHNRWEWHTAVAIASLTAGVATQVNGLRESTLSKLWNLLPAQWFHNCIMIPLYAYFVISTIPIIGFGPWAPWKGSALACCLAWLALLTVDTTRGNLSPSTNTGMQDAIKRMFPGGIDS